MGAASARLLAVGTAVVAADICSEGTYLTSNASAWGPCRGRAECGAGFYCVDGRRYACAAGTFGASPRLEDAACDGPCAAGYYCGAKSDTATQRACGGADVYCPAGSAAPSAVRAGYVAVGGDSSTTRTGEEPCPAGSFCTYGVVKPCPRGTYGARGGLSDAACDGPCERGYFCPAGSTAPTERACGDARFFCPVGAGERSATRPGYRATDAGIGPRAGFSAEALCEMGGHCDKGVRTLCPPGTFSNVSGVQALNASVCFACYAGYVCPRRGHVEGDQDPCGGDDVYCPTGSSTPQAVRPGYYSTFSKNLVGRETINVIRTASTRLRAVGEAPCPEGTYCEKGLVFPCPPGRYGKRAASTNRACDGPCAAGHFCANERRTQPYGEPCGGVGRYCPLGSTAPQPARDGWYTVGGADDSTRVEEARCEPGGWCAGGRRFLCLAGTYNDAYGADRPSACVNGSAGFYVPSDGAVRGDAVPCGAPTLLCPEVGMVRPEVIAFGHASFGGPRGDGTTRTRSRPARAGHYAAGGLEFACAAGRYGARRGLGGEACSGPCAAGFYCPAGSTRPTTTACGGPDLVCPREGMVAPLHVARGYYTTVAANADHDLSFSPTCPAGRYRNYTGVVDASLSENPSRFTAPTSVPEAPCVLCPANTYKQLEGDGYEMCRPCDSSTMADEPGRTGCECLRPPGGYDLEDDEVLIFNYSIALDEASCAVVNSTRALEAAAAAARVFNDSQYTRRAQRPCEPGHWCEGGVRRPCPAGRYGASPREAGAGCSGPCEAGYYCPEASTNATTARCGSADLFCPAGSAMPSEVRPGHFTEEGAPAETRTTEAPCPAGFYCVGGERFPCAAGYYGSRIAANYTDETCEGLCERGHYCAAASSTPRAVECGGPTWACPRGASAPTPIPDGYYGVHASADADERSYYDRGRTRLDAMLPCEPGYYCAGGARRACPEFRFGWRYFQTSADCDGGVAPGCYAPPSAQSPLHGDCPAECGSVDAYCPATGRERRPTAASPGHYTIGGTAATRTGQAPCEPGFYCAGGVKRPCPAGTVQASAGAARCDECPPGNACPAGATEPVPCPGGTFSIGLADSCSSCPHFDGRAPIAGRTQRCFDDRVCCEFY